MKIHLALLLALLLGSSGCGFNHREKNYKKNLALYSCKEDSMMTLFYYKYKVNILEYDFIEKSDQKITFQISDSSNKIYEYESLNHVENLKTRELLINMEKYGVIGFSKQFKRVGVPLYIWGTYRRIYIKGEVTNDIWVNFFNSKEATRIDSIIYARDEPFVR